MRRRRRRLQNDDTFWIFRQMDALLLGCAKLLNGDGCRMFAGHVDETTVSAPSLLLHLLRLLLRRSSLCGRHATDLTFCANPIRNLPPVHVIRSKVTSNLIPERTRTNKNKDSFLIGASRPNSHQLVSRSTFSICSIVFRINSETTTVCLANRGRPASCSLGSGEVSANAGQLPSKVS